MAGLESLTVLLHHAMKAEAEGIGYSSTFSIILAVDVGGGELVSTPLLGRFTPRKDPVAIYRRLSGSQGPSGRVQKI